MTLLPPHRVPTYFGSGLFGWYHAAPAAGPRDCVAVLCAPVGPEYTRSHRTLRHLADRLAAAGVPALRFDYHGIGDSAGEDDAPDRVGAWRRSVVEAARHARELSGRARLCLVGVRLGATLAALEAGELGADLVVLWNPVAKGRAYARELQAIALTADAAPEGVVEGIESAGFRVARATLEALKALDLASARFAPGSRVLILDRDDLAGDAALGERLALEGVAHDRLAAPGWNAMMADHQFTVVPAAALDAIRDWAVAYSRPATPARTPLPAGRPTLALDGVEESPCHFGPGGNLFGILARPAAPGGKPAVVMLNAGSIHHVGPHRLYVRLARELARLGHPSLRFDFQGIGDTPLVAPGRENHPYPESAPADLEAVLEQLRREHGYGRFVLLGVCSGAYHAFHAGRGTADIERLILVNPWYFHWREGLSLDTSPTHYEDVAAYRRSMRDPERWKKLLRAEVDVDRLARVGVAHAAKVVRGRWAEIAEAVRPGHGSRLSRELLRLGRLGRQVHLVTSAGEPAPAILRTEAARAMSRGLREGWLTLDDIPQADHTFSRSAPRAHLVRRVRALLGAG